MDSLPSQHIDSLPGAWREAAYGKAELLCQMRRAGRYTEDEIAEKLDFHNASAMYLQLKNWGLAGLVPSQALTSGSKPPKHRDNYKTRNVTGEPKELPPVTNATNSFSDSIRGLESRLHAISDLKETLQGERFLGEGPQSEDLPPGYTPREAREGQWFPHPYLTMLIGVYILEHGGNRGSVERLVRELHPNPEDANWKVLLRYIHGIQTSADGSRDPKGDGLVHRARQIAALIRGIPEFKRGVKSTPITSPEQFIALDIQAKLEQGLSEEAVARKMQEEWGIGEDEYGRLRNLARNL